MNKLLSLLIILNFSTIHMNGAEQVLTSFETSGQKITDWQIVDDGVMGGLSKGRFNISDDKKLIFTVLLLMTSFPLCTF